MYDLFFLSLLTIHFKKGTHNEKKAKETYLGCVQIVVTKELDPKEHIWLTSLVDGLKENEARMLIEEVGKLTDPDEREFAESVLQLAMETNREIFEKVKGCEDMCQAF